MNRFLMLILVYNVCSCRARDVEAELLIHEVIKNKAEKLNQLSHQGKAFLCGKRSLIVYVGNADRMSTIRWSANSRLSEEEREDIRLMLAAGNLRYAYEVETEAKKLALALATPGFCRDDARVTLLSLIDGPEAQDSRVTLTNFKTVDSAPLSSEPAYWDFADGQLKGPSSKQGADHCRPLFPECEWRDGYYGIGTGSAACEHACPVLCPNELDVASDLEPMVKKVFAQGYRFSEGERARPFDQVLYLFKGHGGRLVLRPQEEQLSASSFLKDDEVREKSPHVTFFDAHGRAPRFQPAFAPFWGRESACQILPDLPECGAPQGSSDGCNGFSKALALATRAVAGKPQYHMEYPWGSSRRSDPDRFAPKRYRHTLDGDFEREITRLDHFGDEETKFANLYARGIDSRDNRPFRSATSTPAIIRSGPRYVPSLEEVRKKQQKSRYDAYINEQRGQLRNKRSRFDHYAQELGFVMINLDPFAYEGAKGEVIWPYSEESADDPLSSSRKNSTSGPKDGTSGPRDSTSGRPDGTSGPKDGTSGLVGGFLTAGLGAAGVSSMGKGMLLHGDQAMASMEARQDHPDGYYQIERFGSLEDAELTSWPRVTLPVPQSSVQFYVMDSCYGKEFLNISGEAVKPRVSIFHDAPLLIGYFDYGAIDRAQYVSLPNVLSLGGALYDIAEMTAELRIRKYCRGDPNCIRQQRRKFHAGKGQMMEKTLGTFGAFEKARDDLFELVEGSREAFAHLETTAFADEDLLLMSQYYGAIDHEFSGGKAVAAERPLTKNFAPEYEQPVLYVYPYVTDSVPEGILNLTR